jgi:hypothetical protein
LGAGKTAIPVISSHEMDCVTMKLMERKTILPLDVVILINSFFQSEKLTDENFYDDCAVV